MTTAFDAPGLPYRRSHPRRILLGMVCLLWLCLLGCASGDYLTVRRIPQNPLAGPLQLLSRKGPQPTPRTVKLLRRYDLLSKQKKDAEGVLERLQQEIAAEPTPEKVYAYAELAYIDGKRAETLGNTTAALEFYAASVASAYQYLFDPRFDLERNAYDPQFRGACQLYNGSLEAALRIVNHQGNLKPGYTQQVEIGQQTYNVTVAVRGPWHQHDFERLEFVNDFELTGLNNHHHTYGLGVPLIAVRKSHPDQSPAEQFYPPGLSFPVTAFLRVIPQQASGERHCLLELHDPMVSPAIQISQRPVPLETDSSIALAHFLDQPELKESKYIGTLGLLNPNMTDRASGLYMLEPYDPNKIPVLMVHGLWSSPLTWMEMFNDLRSFPEIQDRFQFWFYLYPTGQPFWISAAQLREELAHVREILDPGHHIVTLDQMVLVGHSMGGLISRLQTIESGDTFWRIISDQPFNELRASQETRAKLAAMLFFHPNASIRRVISLGTPHRGSDFANDYTRWLGRKLITLPTKLVQTSSGLIRDNPGLFRNTDLLTITTSIDSLAPDSPILPVMLQAPKAPWVRYHNVVGIVPDEGILGRIAGQSDGIVKYASARLEDAESEIQVQADHISIHQHPRSILEVRRILLDHFHQFQNEVAQLLHRPGPPTQPAIQMRY